MLTAIEIVEGMEKDWHARSTDDSRSRVSRAQLLHWAEAANIVAVELLKQEREQEQERGQEHAPKYVVLKIIGWERRQFEDVASPITEELPEGEPFFVLRGQDEFAWPFVEGYATLLHQAGSQTEAAQVQAHAMGMKAWLHKKRPD